MEQAGLITRANRELTPLGWEAALGMGRIFQAQEEHAAGAMTPEEVEQLRVLLQKFCCSALGEEGEKL